ncbi:hypothetical protein ACWF94_40820, partial [Streptomyces sp. NPDC055078]
MSNSSVPSYDLVLAGGTVIDPASATNARLDVAVTGDRIAAIGEGLAANAARTIDVTGSTVLPGLVEGHTHI